MQSNAIQCNTEQYNTMQYNTINCIDCLESPKPGSIFRNEFPIRNHIIQISESDLEATPADSRARIPRVLSNNKRNMIIQQFLMWIFGIRSPNGNPASRSMIKLLDCAWARNWGRVPKVQSIPKPKWHECISRKPLKVETVIQNCSISTGIIS